MKRSALFLLVLAMFIAAGTANALTLKSGEVLSSDGKVYSGASPEQRSAIVAQSKSRGLFGDSKKAGVRGSNIFVVVGEDVVFVPGRCAGQVQGTDDGHHRRGGWQTDRPQRI